MSFIKFPKWAIKIIQSHSANCLWDGNMGMHKFHFVNWDSVSMLKEYGGLGIHNLSRVVNLCLLASWIKRYNVDGHKMWKQLIDFKYDTNNPNLFL